MTYADMFMWLLFRLKVRRFWIQSNPQKLRLYMSWTDRLYRGDFAPYEGGPDR